jgi:predicted ATP-grasp superfamily ATP-dependent carboligase
VNDKTATYKVAKEIGIPIPRTWLPQSEKEAAAPPADLTYPCILKYSDPVSVTPVLQRHGMSLFKSKYCYTEEDLRRVLLEHAPVGCYPLVQSFCPGRGLGHMFFMHQGKAIVRFRFIRLLEWPPEGGVSTVCQSLPVDDGDKLFAKSEELLTRMGWEGAAMVEYRYDPATGRAALMEVNGGRFCGAESLPYHAGVHFVWLTYAVLGLKQPVIPKPYRTGLECRFVAFEVFRLLRILFRPDLVQS